MIRLVLRVVLLLVAALAIAPLPAIAQADRPPEAKLSLVPDALPRNGVVLGEMVLATLRGEYVGNVAKERLEVPPFEGWSWMQLGPADWSQEQLGNRRASVFEVRLAFFPQEAGRREIGPITHHLIFAGSGGRATLDAVSEPVAIEVAEPPLPPTVASGLRQPFWMPSRAVRLTDEWQPAPDHIAAGEWTRRTVTLEVVGLPPEALPPPPQMAAGNLFSFVDGEERTVERTPDGPISKVIWRYRMQPQSSVPAELDNVPVAWFDTEGRVWREEMLRGAEIAFAGTSLPKEPGPIARRGVQVGLGLGVALGALTLLPTLGLGRSGAASRLRRWARAQRAAFELRRAEARRDPARARRALLALLAARRVAPADSAALQRLDRVLFGRPGKAGDLAGLTRQALREVRAGARGSP